MNISRIDTQTKSKVSVCVQLLAKVMYLQSIKPMEKTVNFFPFIFCCFFSLSHKRRGTTRHILKLDVVRITVDSYNERLLSFSKITRLFSTRMEQIVVVFFSSRCFCLSFYYCHAFFLTLILPVLVSCAKFNQKYTGRVIFVPARHMPNRQNSKRTAHTKPATCK